MSSEQGGVTVAEVEQVLKSGLSVDHLVVVDESSGCGSKFVLYVASSQFAGVKTLERHRTVNGLLTAAGLMTKIHAVTIKAWTPAEWEKNIAQVPTQQ